MGGGQLAIQHLLLSAGWKKQVTVKPREVAGDVLLSGNGFNPVDRRAVTFRRQACPPFAVQALDFEVAVVDRIGQMGCGNFGHAAGQRTVVDNDDGLTGLSEQVGGGQAGNACADDAGVRADVLVQGRASRHVGGCRPNRLVLSGPDRQFAFHVMPRKGRRPRRLQKVVQLTYRSLPAYLCASVRHKFRLFVS